MRRQTHGGTRLYCGKLSTDEPPIAPDAEAETAHKTGHKSACNPRMEVITRNDRRKTWTLEQKREIVAESLVGHVSAVSDLAKAIDYALRH